MELRDITTAAEYEAAMIEVEQLMDADPEPGTEPSARLVRLADVIGRYEDKICVGPIG